jgi:hypothetical protein
MKPSEWLAGLGPFDFYPESKLEQLRPYGIAYAGGILTSRMEVGFPYSTYGRLASVPVMSEREFMRLCYQMGLNPTFEMKGDFLLVFGFQVVTSVWSLVRPITIELPPSALYQRPDEKAQKDLEAIRRYGY